MVTITEENWKDALLEFAEGKKYYGEFGKAAESCPYDVRDLPQELAAKECLSWFMFQWVNPATGKTICEEFAENTEIDAGFKAKILRTRQMRQGEFEILGKDGLVLRVKDTESGQVLDAKLSDQSHVGMYSLGRRIRQLIFPWEDGLYHFAGVTRFKESEDEVLARYGLISPKQTMDFYLDQSIGKAESIIIYRHSTVSSIINKYPSGWVDGMCKALGVRERIKDDKVRSIASVLKSGKVTELLGGLPKESGDALHFILERGGVVKYSQLSGKFGDEIGFFWKEHPPKSAVGILRLHGFL